jgi:hypothetical protein
VRGLVINSNRNLEGQSHTAFTTNASIYYQVKGSSSLDYHLLQRGGIADVWEVDHTGTITLETNYTSTAVTLFYQAPTEPTTERKLVPFFTFFIDRGTPTNLPDNIGSTGSVAGEQSSTDQGSAP